VTAFATIDDLLARLDTTPSDKKQTRLEDALEVAADELRDELRGLGEFVPNPATGERTWTVDGEGGSVLHQHGGIISLSLVELSFDYGLSFVTLATTDWLLSSGLVDVDSPPTGEPYFHLHLLRYGSWPWFPRGKATVRLTGVTGWPAPPRALVEGNAARARQIAYGDPSFEGSIPAPEGFGAPTVSNHWPDVTWRFLNRQRDRFYACEA
jgi:hypothetical protein